MSITHLNQVELSRRWSISPRTLERWRWLGQGPQFLKIGGRVVYRLEDIEAVRSREEAGGRKMTATVRMPPPSHQPRTDHFVFSRFAGETERNHSNWCLAGEPVFQSG